MALGAWEGDRPRLGEASHHLFPSAARDKASIVNLREFAKWRESGERTGQGVNVRWLRVVWADGRP